MGTDILTFVENVAINIWIRRDVHSPCESFGHTIIILTGVLWHRYASRPMAASLDTTRTFVNGGCEIDGADSLFPRSHGSTHPCPGRTLRQAFGARCNHGPLDYRICRTRTTCYAEAFCKPRTLTGSLCWSLLAQRCSRKYQQCPPCDLCQQPRLE
jgi:hypothetical protein